MSLFEQLKREAGGLLKTQADGGAVANPAEAAVAEGSIAHVVDALEQHGLGNLLQRLREHGLGAIVASWVGKGANLPISIEQLRHGVAPELIETISARLGIPPEQASALLARFLPGIVDKLTPNSTVDESPNVACPEPSQTQSEETEG